MLSATCHLYNKNIPLSLTQLLDPVCDCFTNIQIYFTSRSSLDIKVYKIQATISFSSVCVVLWPNNGIRKSILEYIIFKIENIFIQTLFSVPYPQLVTVLTTFTQENTRIPYPCRAALLFEDRKIDSRGGGYTISDRHVVDNNHNNNTRGVYIYILYVHSLRCIRSTVTLLFMDFRCMFANR